MFNGFYKNKKVLITGHTGFKGSWLTQWLLDLGAEVVGFSDHQKSEPSLFDLLQLREKIVHISGDVRNEDVLADVLSKHRPQLVFHLAAQALVRRSYENPVTNFATNVMGTVHLLEAVRSQQEVLGTVIVTSDKCYVNSEDGQAYKETAPLGGKDPYSASKACAELVTSSYFHSFFSPEISGARSRLISVRAGNVIGGGDWADNRLIPDCIRSWQNNETVTIRNPTAVRPWQHVLDALGGYLQAMAVLCAPDSKINGQAYNFGPLNESHLQVSAIVEKLRCAFPHGRYNLHQQTDSEKPEAKQLHLNCDKAQHDLHWRPVFTIEDAIQMTCEWYSAYYQKNADPRFITIGQIRSYQQRLKTLEQQ